MKKKNLKKRDKKKRSRQARGVVPKIGFSFRKAEANLEIKRRKANCSRGSKNYDQRDASIHMPTASDNLHVGHFDCERRVHQLSFPGPAHFLVFMYPTRDVIPPRVRPQGASLWRPRGCSPKVQEKIVQKNKDTPKGEQCFVCFLVESGRLRETRTRLSFPDHSCARHPIQSCASFRKSVRFGSFGSVGSVWFVRAGGRRDQLCEG